MSLFVVVLRFGAHRAKASELMAGHQAWIQQGLADGVVLLVGGLRPSAGGVVFARDTSASALRARIEHDPFVAEGVVEVEVLEVEPSKADSRLEFLMER